MTPKPFNYASMMLSAIAVLLLRDPSARAADKTPNVVFILADNVGYGDLGSYGGGELRGAPTPRLDQLARERLRLTQYLVEPACTSSRGALMTGQYSIRNGLSLIALDGTSFTLSKRKPGIASTSAPLAGYSLIYDIEMDPHEDLVVAGLYEWASDPALKLIREYEASIKKYPNPPAPNITIFKSPGG